MLTQLSTVKSRLALTVTDYDDPLTNAIKAVSTRFDKETTPPSACQSPRGKCPNLLEGYNLFHLPLA